MITLTEDEAIDAVSDAMSDVHDMDVSFRQYAQAAVRCMRANGVVFAREPNAPCAHCGKPSTTSHCMMGGCPLGADL